MYASKERGYIARRGSFGTFTRGRNRWPTLLIVVFVLLILFKLSPLTFVPLPYTSRYPNSIKSCPRRPPYPPIVPSPSLGFNWRRVPPQYPVTSYAELPTAWRRKELPPIQYEFEQEVEDMYGELMRKRRQAAVRASFVRSWNAYKEHAWLQDELKPISGGSKTTFGGWGATLVDSLDALWIMDLRDDFEEAVDAITQIDFRPEGELNMFETTIRYLGGLLSAYDLTECKDSRLLEKAIELGDMIYASFDTPNRMPITRWSSVKAAQAAKQAAANNGIIAEMASFSLEFTRLSQLTGDMRFYDAVHRVTTVLDEQQNRTKLPGLWPVGINVRKPNLVDDNYFSLGAMADSAYEYLGKTYQLLRGAGEAVRYRKMYEQAMDAVVQHLLFRPMTPDNADILVPTQARASSPSTVTQDHSLQHLVCFVGGMFALGGRLFQNGTHVEIGRKVTDACVWAYGNAPNGIMPEIFKMTPCPSREGCNYTKPENERHPGFLSVSDARYNLRPEAIESVFYMYRITGDVLYQDIAWEMFQAIDSQTRTPYANAALRDVMLDDGVKEDNMESFWLAETLKYFYLVFSEPNVLSLDDWVFNTEAHPFRLVS